MAVGLRYATGLRARVWLRGLLACALLGAGCTPPQPLAEPLPAETYLAGAVRLAVMDGDLPALAESVKLATGKILQVQAAPWAFDLAQPDGPSPATVTLAAVSVPVDDVALSWTDATHLRFSAHVGKLAADVSLQPVGQVGCGMNWHAAGATISLVARVAADPADGDAPTVQVAEQPAIQWQGVALDGADGCLASQPAGAADALAAQVQSALGLALHQPLASALTGTLALVVPASLQVSGRVAVTTDRTPATEARFALRYAADGQVQLAHAPGLATASLDVAVAGDRHPCAVDAPLPQVTASPLAVPAAPPGDGFLRRAIVLDQALLQRLAWLAARSGLLCAQSRDALSTTLPPGWSAELLPQLDEWIEGPPTGARFWPGSSPSVRLVDTPAGPGVEWTMDDAELDIIARIADTELTALTVTGGFRATLLPRLDEAKGLIFEVASVERLSTHQSSPLLGDLSSPASEAGLSALCQVALQGIFSHGAVLPLAALSPGPLPPGTVVTHVDRAGNSLWLWLEGGGM